MATVRLADAVKNVLARHRLLAYLIPTLLALITIQAWFESGTLLAGGDQAPPVASGFEYVSHWNHYTTGEGAPTFDIVQLPYYGLLTLAEGIGVSEEIAQRLFLSGIYAGAAAGVVFFALSISASPLAAGAAGVFSTFNAFRMVSADDAVALAAVIIATVLGGLTVRASRDDQHPSRGILAFGLVSTFVGYTFINPPHVALILAWLALSVVVAGIIGGRVAARRGLTFLAKAAPLAVLVNLWWIVPAVLTFTNPDFSVRYAAPGVETWSFAHARSSIANVAALNPYWAWAFPEYYPYAQELDQPPLGLFRYWLAVVASVGALALILRGGVARRVGILLASTALVSIFVVKGVHPPLAGISVWLYDHFPGYWLFREPFKVLMITTLAFSLLGGYAVDRLFTMSPPSRLIRGALLLLMVGGSLVYPRPLIAGDAVPTQPAFGGSAHIQIPQDWFRAAEAINGDEAPGKVLVLPQSSYYQMPTTWGYYGVPFTRQIIHRPVLETLLGGYFGYSPSYLRLIGSIEQDLLRGRSTFIDEKLRALGVGFVLLRRDVPTESFGRVFPDPQELESGLDTVPSLDRLESHGLLQVYRLGEDRGEVYAARPVVYSGSPTRIPDALETAPPTTALVSSFGSPSRLSEVSSRATDLALPLITYQRVGSGEFLVGVQDAHETFLLTLTESFNPEWQLEFVRGAGRQVQHVVVNGYANGWIVPSGGGFVARLRYEPEDIARLARRLSVAGLLFASIVSGLLSLERRRRRPHGVGASESRAEYGSQTR